MKIPTARGFRLRRAHKEIVPGRLRRPTTGNGNILHLGHQSCHFELTDVVTGRKFRICRWNFDALSQFQRCKYFRVWLPYRYFRLSVAVAITCRHFFELYIVVTTMCSKEVSPNKCDTNDGQRNRNVVAKPEMLV